MKPVLVHYIEIGSLPIEEVRVHIGHIKNYVGNYNNEYHSIFIPLKEGETRVECLNPNISLNNIEEKENFNKIVENIKKANEDLIEQFPFLNSKKIIIEKI